MQYKYAQLKSRNLLAGLKPFSVKTRVQRKLSEMSRARSRHSNSKKFVKIMGCFVLCNLLAHYISLFSFRKRLRREWEGVVEVVRIASVVVVVKVLVVVVEKNNVKEPLNATTPYLFTDMQMSPFIFISAQKTAN